MSDDTITISYTEDGDTANTTVAITVVANPLASLTIVTPPTTTSYTGGDAFVATGMTLQKTYDFGETDSVNVEDCDITVGGAPVTGYTYSPSTALTKENTEITVSYTESGVTKTASQEIYVDTPPREYTTLDYIESSGSQYIDLGRAFPDGFRITATIRIQNSDLYYIGCMLVGCQANGGNFGRVGVGSFYGNLAIMCGDTYQSNSTVDTSALYEIDACTIPAYRSYYVNGSSVGNMTPQGINPNPLLPATMHLHMFCARNDQQNYQYWYYGRVYGSVKIYTSTDDSELVMSLYPVKRNSDEVIGMYDTVSGTFFTNSGSGSFTGGFLT